ncbi:ran binding protein [Spathaspora passalidarum NRRL Y-27907]|uniref:Ran binding protein n=1 Tax=Spathaspora passalidarum (strain NRRL Y-27907 / 11-Y1) TaxID=619300 RepID=G3AGJ2_SPAPN|nr:ran binding protein [Spathaspora passalidarum NRRL Y-27907]EGW35331.1 ran binding protein [Spathaspora passalidarum NRRL Y-27907]
MDAQFISSLEATLRQTLVPDSAVIKQASQKLTKEFYTNPLALPSLFHILQNGQDDEIKQLASVEARKLVLTNWENIDASLKPNIRESLLQNTFQQPNKRIRHSSARVIAAIAEIDLEKGQWEQLLPTLVEAIQGSDVQIREMGVFTLYTILETQIPSLTPHIDGFLTLFAGLLSDTSSRSIRVNSVLSLDVISQFIEEEGDININLANKFKATIPAMVEVLKEVVSNDDSDSAKQIFNVFNSLIFLDNKLIGDNLINLIQLIAEMSLNTQLDEEYRSFGLQFLISCVSLRKSKISSNKLGPQITLVALKIASEEIDEEAELENEDEENENEENSPPSLGLRLMAMLSAELPPSQVINPMFDALPSMLASTNKFERRGGLLAIGVSSAGAPDYISNQIQKILPAILNGLKDSEIIVRVAALRTLSQLTSELQDVIAEYHEQLLPLVIDIIDTASSVMAYKYACYALDGLIEFMSHDAMGKYIEPLMNKLFHMLQQANSSSLKSAIVSAIGSTAFAAGKAFTPYFKNSVQYLEPFITNAAATEGMTEDDVELRAVTFENISTMARAVGSQSFSDYAKPLVEAAYTSLSSEHSRIRESGFAFISNMAKVYGSEFAGFLEQIVPQILKCLEQDEFTFNVDDLDEDEDDLGNGMNVHTGITIEKEIASVALGELAVGTGKEFAPYVEASVKSLHDQIENSYGMREAAMNCLFKITRAMFIASQGEGFKAPKGVPQQPYVDASILQLVQQVRNIAVPLLEEEFELTMVACILDGFADALHKFGAIAIVDNGNDTSSLEKLCYVLMQILKKEHPCQIEDEEGPADEEDASETDALLYESALEVLVALSLALEGDFVKIFTSFKDVILANARSKSKSMRVGSIGAIAEIVGGLKASNPYGEELLQVFTDRIANDKSLDVKGNAAYGIGLIIENSTADLTSAYPHILQLLFQLLSKADRKADSDDAETNEVVNRSFANASGCVARMALKNLQAVPLEHVLSPLLEHLPLKTGLEENTPIFELILKLYETNNELIVGQTPKIVEIFAGVFAAEADRIKLVNESTLGREENIEAMKQFSSPELQQKVIELLKYLDQKFNGVVSSNEILKSVIAA